MKYHRLAAVFFNQNEANALCIKIEFNYQRITLTYQYGSHDVEKNQGKHLTSLMHVEIAKITAP